MTDDLDHLDEMERDILRRLSLVGEGRALDYDRPNMHRAHPGATEPPGTNTRNLEGPPDARVSLAAYHQHWIVKARLRGPGARLMAIAAATLDYETSKRRGPSYIDPDSAQNERERDMAILRWEGKRPEWVAVFERCSFAYVRKTRVKKRDWAPFGHDPQTGVKLEAERATRDYTKKAA